MLVNFSAHIVLYCIPPLHQLYVRFILKCASLVYTFNIGYILISLYEYFNAVELSFWYLELFLIFCHEIMLLYILISFLLEMHACFSLRCIPRSTETGSWVWVASTWLGYTTCVLEVVHVPYYTPSSSDVVSFVLTTFFTHLLSLWWNIIGILLSREREHLFLYWLGHW